VLIVCNLLAAGFPKLLLVFAVLQTPATCRTGKAAQLMMLSSEHLHLAAKAEQQSVSGTTLVLNIRALQLLQHNNALQTTQHKVMKGCEAHLMTRALPCGTSLQNLSISFRQACFMGYWKSMFWLKFTSSSNSRVLHSGLNFSRLFCRQRMTLADPCTTTPKT
jgi:hypothetical protein